MTLDDIIHEMLKAYAEHNGEKSMQYTYGYMDAVAVLREIAADPLRQKLQA